MSPEFETKIRNIVEACVSDVWVQDADAVIEAIKHEYEFKCPSFIYAGPGHQSKHTCEYRRPHELDGEHSDSMYEWEGTSYIDENGKLHNAKHQGYGCYC